MTAPERSQDDRRGQGTEPGESTLRGRLSGEPEEPGDRSASVEGGDHSDEESEPADDRHRKRRAAVRPHEFGPAGSQGSEDENADDSTRDRWAPEGIDPDEVPWYFAPVSVEDPDPPKIVDRLGTVGIYLAVAALVLAVIGVVAAAIGIQPFGNLAITLSLGVGILAMLLGMVFQSFASDFLSRSD